MNIATTALVNASGTLIAAGFDPGVTPDGGAPWMSTMRTIAGYVLATCLVVLVILGIVAVVLLVMGKIGHHGMGQAVGVTVLIWTLIGAALIACMSGLIYFFSNMNLA